MQLFHWQSQFLAQVGTGTIAVMDASVEAAREKVLGDFDHLIDNLFPHLDRSDPDDTQEIAEMREKLQSDLAREPQTQDRIYVIGSS